MPNKQYFTVPKPLLHSNTCNRLEIWSIFCSLPFAFVPSWKAVKGDRATRIQHYFSFSLWTSISPVNTLPHQSASQCFDFSSQFCALGFQCDCSPLPNELIQYSVTCPLLPIFFFFFNQREKRSQTGTWYRDLLIAKGRNHLQWVWHTAAASTKCITQCTAVAERRRSQAHWLPVGYQGLNCKSFEVFKCQRWQSSA